MTRPADPSDYIEELRSALEKGKRRGWDDRVELGGLFQNHADQLLTDARIGQLVREGGEEVVDKVARAIMSSGGCGLTIEGERTFCDDQRAPEGVRTYCDCHAQARAALRTLAEQESSR